MRDREDLIDELFNAASDLDAGGRADYFAARRKDNGDALLTEGVFKEVYMMLEANDAARDNDFLQQPFFADDDEAHTFDDPLTQQPLDGYTLLGLIARGGMGEVYLARDKELNFDVAVKIVRGGGFGRADLIRRFHAERRILAGLKHPNIARVFKGGATTDGLPYLVMEYVDGHPIIEYANKRKLSINERLELFRKACSAVAYAHQHLVIHRDIKPSNVLVTNDGEPKLLDFGIAKLLDPTHASDETVTGLRAMTPEYASPEQLKGGTVTTATDVYSLGVLLYELLTEDHPYRAKSSNPGELEQAICTIEPPRPSASINTEKLHARELRGDLDNIVLMALRKEPARRYASVGEFAEDIRRHLEGLPVIAHKDTLSYRANKFIRRNKVAVGASPVVLLALLGGIVATAWEAHVARQERARAERRFNDVRQLAHTFIFDLNNEIAKSPTQARVLIVSRALEYLDSLSQEANNDRSLRQELAVAYMRIGDLQGAPYTANLGDIKGARVSYGKSAQILEELTKTDAADVKARVDLSDAYQMTSTLESISSDWTASLESARKAVRICEELLTIDPANAEYRQLVGRSYISLGDTLARSANVNASLEQSREALKLYQKALAIRQDLLSANPIDAELRRRVALNYERIGFGYTRLYKLDADAESNRQALQNFRQAQAIREALLALEPSNRRYKRTVADGHMELGMAQHNLGDDTNALEDYRQAQRVFEELAATDSANTDAQRDLFYIYVNIAASLAKLGDWRSTREHVRRALLIYEQLRAADPKNIEDREQIIILYNAMGDASSGIGDTNVALESYRKALSVIESWRADEPSSTQQRRELAKEYVDIGNVYAVIAANVKLTRADKAANWREARVWYERSLNLWQEMREHGALSNADAGKPEQLTRQIAECDAALKARR